MGPHSGFVGPEIYRIGEVVLLGKKKIQNHQYKTRSDVNINLEWQRKRQPISAVLEILLFPEIFLVNTNFFS